MHNEEEEPAINDHFHEATGYVDCDGRSIREGDIIAASDNVGEEYLVAWDCAAGDWIAYNRRSDVLLRRLRLDDWILIGSLQDDPWARGQFDDDTDQR